MKKTFLIILSIIIASFLTGCRKDKINKYYVSDAVKSFFLYNQGTNWQYHEDSLNINQQISMCDNITDMRGNVYDNDLSEWKLIELVFDDSTSVGVIMCYPDYSIYTERYKDQYHCYFNFPNSKIETDPLESISVLGVNYDDVLHLNNDSTDVWIAKKIGVIKKIIRRNNKTWYWSLSNAELGANHFGLNKKKNI
ncbi:MAG: hypothetical protein WCK02_11450 [Bacteroidota bacterium]